MLGTASFGKAYTFNTTVLSIQPYPLLIIITLIFPSSFFFLLYIIMFICMLLHLSFHTKKGIHNNLQKPASLFNSRVRAKDDSKM